MIQDLIQTVWDDVLIDIINESHRFSSEKSIVFDFAWKLKKQFGDKIQVDFEKRLYDNFSDGQFLDLYFEYEGVKVGLEFKYPRSTGFVNSNQTQTRKKIVNDVKRLSFLVNSKKIDFGIFLLVTNEKPYIFVGKKNISSEFQTYSNTTYKMGQLLPIDLKSSKEEVICPKDIVFNWIGIDNKNILNSVAWIEPIIIHD